mmetsp:Transcript_35250/g.105310  ORF Transcript_35250/g.105310 Transcript_35250/m.105310 type:complete len:135 (-) Transcript_35250:29-433(-)
MSYGSEFRPVPQLDPLLQHQPNWPHLQDNLSAGVKYSAPALPEKERRDAVDWMINRGNHKSATSAEAVPILEKLAKEDVELAYSLPLTVGCVRKLRRAEVYPLCITSQLTINAKGETIPKKIVNHDLSFPRRGG